MKIFRIIIFSFLVIFISACNGNKTTDKENSTNPGIETESIKIEQLDTIKPVDNTDVVKESPEVFVDKPKSEAKTSQTDGMLRGTMMVKGDAWIIRTEDGEQKDYYPTNLEADFKVEGLTVGFSGTLQEIPPNVRMVGQPIELSKIIKMQIKN